MGINLTHTAINALTNEYDGSELKIWLGPSDLIPDHQTEGIIYIGYENEN